MHELEQGRICVSNAGRDRGRYFIIKEVSQDGCVYIVDGIVRKVAKPKKKKLKHVTLRKEKAEAIGEKFAQGTKVFDAEVRSAINALTGEED